MKRYFILSALLCLTSVVFSQITEFPWVEDFESSDLPTDWTQQYQTANVDWITNSGSIYGDPATAFSGTKNAFFAADNYDDNQTMLISPAMDITTLANPVLSFYHSQVPFESDQDELYVYYKTSAAGSWVLLESYTSEVLTWTKYEILLPVVSSDFYLGFSAKSGYGLGVCLDLVKVEDQIPCNIPTDVLVLQTWEAGALIEWTGNGNESQWQIEYGLEGYTQGGGTVVTSNNESYTFLNLLSSQPYEFYLRSFCNPLYSDWIGPFSFTTDCSATTVFPFLESFENTEVPAHCWTIEYANPSPNPQNLITHTATYSYDGARSVKFSSLYSGAPYNQYLISREFSFTQNMQLTFRYRKNITGTETFSIGTSSTTNITSAFTWSNNITDAETAWKYITYEIPSNTKFIAIQYKSNFQNSLFVDDLRIDISQECYTPIDIAVGNVGSQDAEISWLAQNGETSWFVEYGLEGFIPGTGTSVSVTQNPYTIVGLNPETIYDFYISADCGSSTSEQSSKMSFTTLPLCLPLTDLNVLGLTHNSVNLGWIQNGAVFYEIEYGVSGFMHGSGLFESSLTTASENITGLLSNTEYDFYIRAYCGAANGFSEWYGPITQRTYLCSDGCYYTFALNDYLGDGWDEVSLDVYQNGTFTNNLTLLGGSNQEYQVFICNGANIEVLLNQSSFSDECSYSIYSPYDVFVTSKEFGTLGSLPDQSLLDSFIADCSEPACYPPVGPELSNLTNNSCLITWSAGLGVSTYRIEYDATGFVAGTGIFINDISELSYELTSLSQLTEYDVYVYSDCDVDGLSEPVGPINFTTLSTPVALDLCGLNIDIADNDYIQVNFNVSGQNPTTPFTHIYPETVSFIIEHPNVDEIDLYLESPEGITVSLVQDAGEDGDNFGDISGSCSYKTIVSLNPTHGPISSGTAPFNGNYSPLGNLDDYNTGADMNGIWKLRIADDNTFFTGQLVYFNITFNESRTLLVSETTFFEDISNNGSISNSIEVSLYNETFANTGILTLNTDYTVDNLPEGLSVEVNVLNSNSAQISLVGFANNHVYDIDNLDINFLDNCFTNAEAASVEGNFQTFSIDYLHTDNLSNDIVWETSYCFDPSTPMYVNYKISNDGEDMLAEGTEFDLFVEFPVGTPLFSETIFISEELSVGGIITGICSNPIYFTEAGTFIVKTIIEFDNDSDPADNEMNSQFSAISHETIFPQATNDSIYIGSFPLLITTESTFVPASFEQPLVYNWNGIEGGSTFEVFSEGWVYLSSESDYCTFEDSVYIALMMGSKPYYNDDIQIYPNPASDFICISSQNSKISMVRLITIDGRIAYENKNFTDEHFVKLEINHLKSGLYIIYTETEEGQFKRNFIKI